MNRQEFDIEFVPDNFSVAKTSCCPHCKMSICFLPDIKSLVKKDCRAVIDLLKESGQSVKEVDRISVKEWHCWNCKTIFINITEKTYVFN